MHTADLKNNVVITFAARFAKFLGKLESLLQSCQIGCEFANQIANFDTKVPTSARFDETFCKYVIKKGFGYAKLLETNVIKIKHSASRKHVVSNKLVFPVASRRLRLKSILHMGKPSSFIQLTNAKDLKLKIMPHRNR